MTSWSNVTNLFLKWGNFDGEIITNLKMQKLLYYAQAWHLVHFSKLIFKENVEAWEFGPVVSEAYRELKKFRYSAIYYTSSGKEEKFFSSDQVSFLKSCYEAFIKFSPHELVNMTHNEDPWKNAFEEGAGTIISPQSMKKYYSKLI